MQAHKTLTQTKGFNRLTAGAIGIALLVASAIGAVALNQQVDLPLIGGNSQTQTRLTQNPMAEMLLVKQISFDYATVEPIDPLFLEENSFDYQLAANYASAESIRFIEANVFEYATAPVTTQQIRFHEENVWEREGSMTPPVDTGATDY